MKDFEDTAKCSRKPLNQFPGLELLLDDESIAYKRNIRRELRKPDIHEPNPVIRREFPWESKHVCLYGTVMRDEERGIFRMWYNAYGEISRDEQRLCYAESKDGVNWTKPMLDIYSYGKYKKTNILLGPPETNLHGPCVLKNPDASDKRRRYLLLFDSYPKWHKKGFEWRGCYTAESPDGLRWSNIRPAFPGKADSGASVMWDPAAGAFRAYTRETAADAFGQRIRIWKLNESKDFVNWSDSVEILRADEKDGYPDAQVQHLSVTKFATAYIGLLSMFRVSQYVVSEGAIDEGIQVNDIQLVTSRDGVHFTRVAGRALFMEHIEYPEKFRNWGYRTASNLFCHDGKVWIYHDIRYPDDGFEIGLAAIPEDRFVSMLPERMTEEGIIELKPMRYQSGMMTVNADKGAAGRIQAEAADFDGNVIQGYSRHESTETAGDSGVYEICWRKNRNSYGLPCNQPVRLRLWLRQARVFALRQEM